MAVPPPFPEPDRATLRRELRARRRDFAGDAGAIVQRLAPFLAHDGPIAGYVAQGGEPDIMPFLRDAFDCGRAVTLPHLSVLDEGGASGAARLATRATMDFVRWHPGAAMALGLLGIPQVTDGAPLEPTILLTPLVGFDRAGNRLGQGGGFYDRWFAAHPAAMRIGVAWSVQEVPTLAAAPWDMPLHAIVTELEWITPS
jgi:5-formyltetrahydrofolate cyclo-ligase